MALVVVLVAIPLVVHHFEASVAAHVLLALPISVVERFVLDRIAKGQRE